MPKFQWQHSYHTTNLQRDNILTQCFEFESWSEQLAALHCYTQFETKSHVYVTASCKNQTYIIPWSHCVDIIELTLRRVCIRRSCIYLQSACESTLNGFSSAVPQMWLCNWKHEDTTLHGTASVRYTVEPLLKDTSEISTPWLIRTLDWVATLYINTNYSLPEIRTPHLSVHNITREYYAPKIHLAMFQPDLDHCQAKLGLSVQHRTITLVPRGVFILDAHNKC